MTLYESEISKIKEACYSNDKQLETVIDTRHFIDNNLDRKLNLDLLSSSHFTSKFHFLRLFKKYYGQTPNEYITGKRMERAKEYLIQGITITETCFAIGFESPCSFSTLFKSRVGMSPTAFQKKAIFAR